MKNLLSIIFIIGIIGISNAQVTRIKETDKADINWGLAVKKDKKTSFISVVSHDKSGYVILKSIRKGRTITYALTRYGNDLTLKSTILLPSVNGKAKLSYQGIEKLGNNLIYMAFSKNKKLKTNTLYYQVINPSSMTLDGRLEKVSELKFLKKRQAGGFSFTTSKDESKLMVFTSSPITPLTAAKFHVKVLNNKLSELWESEIEIPFKEQYFSVNRLAVGNNGDLNILGKEYSTNRHEKRKDKTRPSYKYHIVNYSNKGSKVKDYEIEIGDKFITEIAYKLDDKNNLMCAGFYGENSTSGIKGTFFLKIDGETKKITKSSYKEFGENFITQGWTDKQVRKAKKKEAKKKQAVQMYKYDLRNFILREDGGAVLIAEQYYLHIVTSTYTDSKGVSHTTTTYHYYYNDIIVVNINPKGEIDWATKIEKMQHTVNDGGWLSSFALHVKDDKMYFVYNEKAKQFYDKEERSEMKGKDKRAYLTLLVTVENNGDYEKEILLNNSEDGSYTVPKLCEQTSDNEMLIYSSVGKNQKFGVMTIKDR